MLQIGTIYHTLSSRVVASVCLIFLASIFNACFDFEMKMREETVGSEVKGES